MPATQRSYIVAFVTKKCRPDLDKATLFRLAADASCDPRTIQRVYEGRTVRGMAGERARAALVKAGHLPEEVSK